MANLVIDIGNTALKAAWTEGMTLGKTSRYQGERMMDFILSLLSDQKPEVMILSSVRKFSDSEISILKDNCVKFVHIDDELAERYSIPLYLSPDRIASLVAARYLFRGKGCTVFGRSFFCDKNQLHLCSLVCGDPNRQQQSNGNL